MEAIAAVPTGLKPGDGMGDFMRFTTDAPLQDATPLAPTDGFTHWPATEPAQTRLSRIGIFRRLAGHDVLRLL